MQLWEVSLHEGKLFVQFYFSELDRAYGGFDICYFMQVLVLEVKPELRFVKFKPTAMLDQHQCQLVSQIGDAISLLHCLRRLLHHLLALNGLQRLNQVIDQ